MSFAFLSRTFQESDLVLNFGVWCLWRRSHRSCEDSSERGKAGNHNVASRNLVSAGSGLELINGSVPDLLISVTISGSGTGLLQGTSVFSGSLCTPRHIKDSRASCSRVDIDVSSEG